METENILNENLPNNLFILPLSPKPIFPGLFTPLVVMGSENIEIINQAISHGGIIGTLMIKDPAGSNVDGEKFYKIGTVCRILKSIKLPDGGMNIFVSTLKRFKAEKFYSSGPYLVAGVTYLEDVMDKSDELKAWTRELATELKTTSKNIPIFSSEMKLNMVNIDQPAKFADYMASIIEVDGKKQQEILETLNVRQRIEKVLFLIREETKIAEMQAQIQDKINEKLERGQRNYFLKEELKYIQKELGMTGKQRPNPLASIKADIDKLNVKAEVKDALLNEFYKMAALDPNNPEYTITLNYLQTALALPWSDEVDPDYQMSKVEKTLNRDHYGLLDVKERILEFLAVRKLRNDTKGAIICLVGPPGVGKTSIGISIAEALGKKYFRFSVGGMRDEAEIKGHRRTYVGAMPGKVIQGLKIVKTKSPVFLIDEIDKMGMSNQGDPASALLEVLDPEQNTEFRDRYLDLPFDLSQVLFIVTANSLDTIPTPLLDRMEIIRLSGYTSNEKLHIGQKYLVPKSLTKNGLQKSEVKYSKKILLTIAEQYAREAGVRNFEKALDKINRKIAKEVASKDDIAFPITIDEEKVLKYLGEPMFPSDDVIKADIPGTAIGLAWTSMGGDTLLIEAENYPGKGELKITGQLGSVMTESVNIAWTYLKREAERRQIDKAWFLNNAVHLHVPEGATPKDGPSAGITITTALYSLLTNQAILPHLAMTGELTLTGKVMPIGGLKEKVLAAKRNKINTIIIPFNNKRDLDKLEKDVTDGITFYPVKDMQEVLKIAFPKDNSVRLSEKEYQKSLTTQDDANDEKAKDEKLASLIAETVARVLNSK